MMGTAYPEQVADTTKVCAVAERDLDRLEKWAGMKHIKFNEGKCKVLHLGGIIPSAIQGLRSSLAERNLKVLRDSRLNHVSNVFLW